MLWQQQSAVQNIYAVVAVSSGGRRDYDGGGFKHRGVLFPVPVSHQSTTT